MDLALSRRLSAGEDSDGMDDEKDENPSPSVSSTSLGLLPCCSYRLSLRSLPVFLQRSPHSSSHSSDLDIFSNEILTEILHHLHQPFHFFHYSNALLGITDTPPESKPWNPVGLQAVSRRFKAIAQPLFYRQVALDAQNDASLDLAADAVEDFPGHPLHMTRDTVWINVEGRYENSMDNVLMPLSNGRFANRVICLTAGGTMCDWWSARWLERTVILREGVGVDLLLSDIFNVLATLQHRDERKRRPVFTPFSHVHRNHLLILHLHLSTLLPTLAYILKIMPTIPYLPRLQLDFPFDLSSSILDSIFPVLSSIVQHPSLPEGRDFIFQQTENVKQISLEQRRRRKRLLFEGSSRSWERRRWLSTLLFCRVYRVVKRGEWASDSFKFIVLSFVSNLPSSCRRRFSGDD